MKLKLPKVNKQTFIKSTKALTKAFKDNRATIATGIACTAVIVTAVESSKAAVPADMALADAELVKGSKLNAWEKIKVAGPYYIKTGAAAAVAIGGSIYSRVTDAKEIKELTGTVTTLYEGFKTYKEATKEEVGKNKETKITQKAAENQIESQQITMNDIILTGKGNDIGVDSYFSNRKFFTSYETLRKAENDLNDEIRNEGFASLNFFYRCLGIEETGLGDDIGWSLPVEFVRYLPTTWVEVDGLGRRTAIDLTFPYDSMPRYGYEI